ncbi:MAG TPA: TetR/AcrR family transcriptional regulator [Caulobacteraceae bacterium]|nr:TetR/AcrR family transcriptional regulator [Caulobacteraceae bacterium]
MRYDAEHKQRTRERVLREAAKAMRAEGPHQIAVAGVMAKAGLTHGGFYAHFASRDDLVVAAIGQMFEEGGERLALATSGRPPAEGLAAYIDFYLSGEHRDARTSGCPMPFMAADLPRLSEPARARFALGVAGLRTRLGALLAELGHEDARTEASSMLAELVGALSLARAEPDRERSDAVLARSKTSLKQRFGLEPRQ